MAYITPVGAPTPPHLFDKPTPPSSEKPTSASEAERVKQGLPESRIPKKSEP